MYWHLSIAHTSRDGHSPFAFAPPWPFSAGDEASFRIRLLGGRTLERRKWCWSWLFGAARAGERAVGFSWTPGGLDVWVERVGAKPGLAALDGLSVSSPTLFVLSSLAWSALSPSSPPSGFRSGLLGPSTPEPPPWPTVILRKHKPSIFVNIFRDSKQRSTWKDDILLNSTWPPLFVSNPLSPSRQIASKNIHSLIHECDQKHLFCSHHRLLFV